MIGRKWIALGAAACAALGIAAWAPWSPPPPLYYEAVTGYPMKIYFRNLGDSIIEVVAAGGVPALSDLPLPQERIDAYFAEVRNHVSPGKSAVKGGEFVRFVIDDPEELAWKPGKDLEKTTYFYLFAVIETPRAAPVNNRWIREVCLVSKTAEPFTPCPTHNEMYASR